KNMKIKTSMNKKRLSEDKAMKDLIPLMIGIGIPLIMGIGGPLLYVRSTDRRWEKIIISNQQQMAQRDREFTTFQREFNAQAAQRDREWMEFRREFFNKKD
ncbi:MAG: hypothetical protein RR927_05040, partial [Victivallaceae bacterium]